MKISEILLEDRTEFLQNRYLPIIRSKSSSLRIPADVKQQIANQPGSTSEEKIFNWLVGLDPTKNRQYLQWILGCAIDKSVPFEDMVYVKDSLTTYDQRKRQNTLPVEARDINRIKTPSQLDVLLRGVQGAEASADAAEEAGARNQSKIIRDDADWLILIPKTEFAAQFYGRGTEWCTAWGDKKGLHPDRSCRFNDYNRDGPLIIMINKADPSERYQFHRSSKQLMNRDDKPISLDKFKKILPFLHGPNLNWVPVTYITHVNKQAISLVPSKMQLAAVKKNGLAIEFIKNPTLEMQLAAVKEWGSVIEYIKNPTPEVQLAAVQQNGLAIEFIKNPTPEVQLAAVQQNGLAIEFIKNPTPEMQLAAVQKNGLAIEFIKNPTLEMQLAAVQKNGLAIQFIKNPTLEMQLAAVKKNGLAIEFIKNPTPEMQLAAVKKNGLAIEFIKNPTPEMQLAAVKQNATAIWLIKNPTPEIQLAAVKQNGFAINYIRNPAPEVIELARRQGYDRKGNKIT